MYQEGTGIYKLSLAGSVQVFVEQPSYSGRFRILGIERLLTGVKEFLNSDGTYSVFGS